MKNTTVKTTEKIEDLVAFETYSEMKQQKEDLDMVIKQLVDIIKDQQSKNDKLTEQLKQSKAETKSWKNAAKQGYTII
tara:strand:+ start:2666 stop:2899 length:234 start_codon:yes stop_codon:yes gene_type:complete